MVTDLTTEASLKTFWPDVANEFLPSVLSSQINLYITRATYLLNALGNIMLAVDGAPAILQMAANIVTRRLIYWDHHPAAAAEPANVRQEAVQGLSYSLYSEPRTLASILGDEVVQLVTLTGVILVEQESLLMTSTVVFNNVLAFTHDLDGNRVNLFDPRLDDSLERTLSEQLFNAGRNPWNAFWQRGNPGNYGSGSP